MTSENSKINYLNFAYGVKSWLLTTDHKRIALLYLISITFFFAIGGIFATLIRLELLTPQGDLFQSENYNKVFTMHGVIMVFLFLIPAIPAVLGNFLVPLMIGARDMALPRVNLLSWYLYILGGLGLLLYGLTATFAVVDWMMSLEPHWFSTLYGLLVIVGQVLSAFAFVIAIASILMQYKPLSEVLTKTIFHDLGKLMFAFIMIWAYLAFSQFLIIWSGNLPEEIPWYKHRLSHGWQIIGLALVLFHFALPFLLLLSRDLKRNPRLLAIIAIGVLVMRVVDLYWMVGPEFHPHGFTVHLLDILLPVGIGGIWLAFFFKQLKALPLVPANDPNLQEEHG